MKKHKFCPACKGTLSNKVIEGSKRLACPECGWVHYANPLPSAVAFVRNDDGRILLVKRGIEPGKGKWALPSGFVEMNEMPEETVIRELKEETNVQGVAKKLIGVYTQPSKVYGGVVLIAYDVQYAQAKLRAGSDSIDARFFAANKLPPIPFVSHRRIIRDALAAKDASKGMQIHMLKSKITEAIITHTHLYYKGSMGIDGKVMKAAGIFPSEKVHVLNYDNGERLETYTIEEKPGSGRMVLYGPASRKGKVGQRLCILSYAIIDNADAEKHKPKVIRLNSKNKIIRSRAH